jgi:CheY-like chemotaxis protein
MRPVKPPRVLIVDDTAAVRDLWCDTLSLLGYEVMPAEDGRAALARLEAAAYDLVVIDLFMPGRSGWQLVNAIRCQGTTRLLLISGSGSETDVALAQAQGLTLLQKPIRLVEFQRAVELVLHGN